MDVVIGMGGGLWGVARDQLGQPVPDVDVVITAWVTSGANAGRVAFQRQTTTDVGGLYEAYKLPGLYDYSIDYYKPGYGWTSWPGVSAYYDPT